MDLLIEGGKIEPITVHTYSLRKRAVWYKLRIPADRFISSKRLMLPPDSVLGKNI